MQNSSNQPQQPSMQEILRMAATPEGKQLISLLKNRKDPNFQKMLSGASAGNYTQAKEALAQLLQDPAVRELVQRMGGA